MAYDMSEVMSALGGGERSGVVNCFYMYVLCFGSIMLLYQVNVACK